MFEVVIDALADIGRSMRPTRKGPTPNKYKPVNATTEFRGVALHRNTGRRDDRKAAKREWPKRRYDIAHVGNLFRP
jgi:hypothetical protein